MRGSRNFRQGGGGGGGGGGGAVQVSLTKKSSDVFFFVFFLSSAYFTEVKWSISKKSIIFNCSRGGPTFPGGSNCLFPIETHITCDFPGGGSRPPVPPSGSALALHIVASVL